MLGLLVLFAAWGAIGYRSFSSGVDQANGKRDELVAQNDELKTVGAQLTEVVTGLEGEVRRLMPTLPEPLRKRLLPLFQRMPEDPKSTKVSVAERFQNVLGMLNEANKANQEIAVEYEVRDKIESRYARANMTRRAERV